MRLVIQRVLESSVRIDGKVVGQIGRGYMVLCGVEDGDTQDDLRYCIDKTVNLRIFEDDAGKMNRSLVDIGGSVLAISQFTLLGDARHGRRPSFSHAARPELAEPLCDMVRDLLIAQGVPVLTGRFRTHMKVDLLNDGPVTILLDSKRNF